MNAELRLLPCFEKQNNIRRAIVLAQNIKEDALKNFEKQTGISALLNTSFNLHGYPIVCTPIDAINTLKNSGLRHLAIGNFLISKK